MTFAAAMAAFLVASSVAEAKTRELAADVGSFCRDRYGPTATPGIDRRDGALLCTARVSGGLAMQHYRIRPSRVCLSQHRTSRFRRSGTRIICMVRTASRKNGRRDDGRQRERAISLATYCRKAYGPDAKLTRRRTDDRPMCSVRTDRGLGLRHHVIDPRRVCGGQRYRLAGSRVYCAIAKRQPTKQASKTKTIDLRNFCRRAFGPSTIVTRRRTDGRPMCTVRTDNGLGLRHHVIDPGRACGGRRYRIDGNRLLCAARG